jgi:hypothetical protein
MVGMRDTRARKLNQYQRLIDLKARTEYYQHGEGLYVFRNKTSGTLELPKPTMSGTTHVGPKQEWQGDDYYMPLVRKNEAVMVKCLLTPEQTIEMKKQKENPVNEQKLILDQPDRVTHGGTVEQVASNAPSPINEVSPVEQKIKEEILINEDPMEGVDILMG